MQSQVKSRLLKIIYRNQNDGFACKINIKQGWYNNLCVNKGKILYLQMKFEGEIILIKVSKEEFERLEKAKLIDHSEMNKNYTILNRHKDSKRKKYYVEASRSILNFLNRRDDN